MIRKYNWLATVISVIVIWPAVIVTVKLLFPRVPDLVVFWISVIVAAVSNAVIHKRWSQGNSVVSVGLFPNGVRQEDLESAVRSFADAANERVREEAAGAIVQIADAMDSDVRIAVSKDCARMLAQNIGIGNAEASPQVAIASLRLIEAARLVECISATKNLVEMNSPERWYPMIQAQATRVLGTLLRERAILEDSKRLGRPACTEQHVLLKPIQDDAIEDDPDKWQKERSQT